MLFKKDELRLLWPFYLGILILSISSVIMPFIVIYFQELGINYFQIGMIMMGITLGVFLFEVPTGAFADTISRKYSVVLGYAIMSIPLLLFPIFKEPSTLFILWFIAGIGQTFASGAEEAWVVDNLKKERRERLIQEYFIKSTSIYSFGFVISPLIGMFLVKYISLSSLWYFMGAGFFINMLILLIFTKELYKPRKTKKKILTTIKNTKKSFKFIKNHKVILLILLGILALELTDIGNIGWQPLLVDLGLKINELGIVFSLIALLVMISPFIVNKLKGKKIKNTLITIMLIQIIVLGSILFIHPPLFIPAIIFILILNSTYSIHDTIIGPYKHRFIPSKIRSTVSSTENMMRSLSHIILLLFGGLLLDTIGIKETIALGAIFAVIAIIIYRKLPNDTIQVTKK